MAPSKQAGGGSSSGGKVSDERDPFVIDDDDDDDNDHQNRHGKKRSSNDEQREHQHRQELLHSAQDGGLPDSLRPPSLKGHTGSKVTGNALLYGVSVFSSLGVFLFGWDQG